MRLPGLVELDPHVGDGALMAPDPGDPERIIASRDVAAVATHVAGESRVPDSGDPFRPDVAKAAERISEVPYGTTHFLLDPGLGVNEFPLRRLDRFGTEIWMVPGVAADVESHALHLPSLPPAHHHRPAAFLRIPPKLPIGADEPGGEIERCRQPELQKNGSGKVVVVEVPVVEGDHDFATGELAVISNPVEQFGERDHVVPGLEHAHDVPEVSGGHGDAIVGMRFAQGVEHKDRRPTLPRADAPLAAESRGATPVQRMIYKSANRILHGTSTTVEPDRARGVRGVRAWDESRAEVGTSPPGRQIVACARDARVTSEGSASCRKGVLHAVMKAMPDATQGER